MRKIFSLLSFTAVLVVGCAESSVNPEPVRPDAEELYYTVVTGSGDNADVYAIFSDGSGKRKIASANAIFCSPVGNIVVTSQQSGSILRYNTAGELQEVILSSALGEYPNPVLSPAGNKIAYRVFSGSRTELYVINTDGSGAILLELNAASETIPVWSPDGTQLAYLKQGQEVGGIDHDSLFIINSDGTGRRFLMADAISMNDNFESLDWSPDGNWIACATDGGGETMQIAVVSVATGSTTTITSGTGPKAMPAWSPDSQRIAYIGAEGLSPTSPMYLIIVNADGSSTQRYPASGSSFIGYPQWSPRGNYIVFTDGSAFGSNEGTGMLSALTVSTGEIKALDLAAYKGFWRK